MVLWNAIMTLFVNIQIKSKARRGKAAAHNAKTQPKHMMSTFQYEHRWTSREFCCMYMSCDAVHFIALSINHNFYTAENSIY